MGRTKRQRKRKVIRTEGAESFVNVFQLQKWMNFDKPNLKVVSFGEAGRGVISTKNIKSGEEVIAVPLKCMVTHQLVNKSKVPTFFEAPPTSPLVAITLWLVYENHLGENSAFCPYISVLPTSFSSLLFLSEVERRFLPPWILKHVDAKLEEAENFFSTCTLATIQCDHCEKRLESIFTYESFLWAWSCVNTRCVYYESDENGEKESSVALAPFLDFFNHSNSANVEAKLDFKRNVYSLKTNKPFAKYEQIFIKYGAFSNLRLLVEYGFILDDEDQDAVEFSLPEVLAAVKVVNPHYADISKLKYKFININSLNVNLSKGKDEFSWNVKGLLYILVTQDTNLAQLLSNTYSSTWGDRDAQLIEEIQTEMLRQKRLQLLGQLAAMETLKTCSEGFKLAKDLVRLYLKILGCGEG